MLSIAQKLAGHPSPRRARELSQKGYRPGRIPNLYNLLLPGEREALRETPSAGSITGDEVLARSGDESAALKVGQSIGGWQLVATLPWLNGVPTVLLEVFGMERAHCSEAKQLGELWALSGTADLV